MPAMPSRFPAMWRTPTPIRARSRRGSRWLSSSRVWGPGPPRRPTMAELGSPDDLLAGASVEAAVFALRPDYRALLVAVDGVVPSPSDEASEVLLQAAETAARTTLEVSAVDQ